MTHFVLDRGAEFSEGTLMPFWNEDGIEPETTVASHPLGDAALADAIKMVRLRLFIDVTKVGPEGRAAALQFHVGQQGQDAVVADRLLGMLAVHAGKSFESRDEEASIFEQERWLNAHGGQVAGTGFGDACQLIVLDFRIAALVLDDSDAEGIHEGAELLDLAGISGDEGDGVRQGHARARRMARFKAQVASR